jgi:Fic family protein
MILLPIDIIDVDQKTIREIDEVIKSIYRLIIYSRHHSDDDLLDTYLGSIHNLRQLVGIKNAQMEAQTEEEAQEYLANLQISLEFVVEEINSHINFESEIQLFQLLRLISPEATTKHPNRYRQTLVQIGAHICPDSEFVPNLVSELFYRMNLIQNPIIKAIYLHHELIRIHPFVDGNGRVTRIAKNWLLMFDLYPPIFINDADQKKEYIETLAKSFSSLSDSPDEWNKHTKAFFEQELKRILTNARLLYASVNKIGINRSENKKE